MVQGVTFNVQVSKHGYTPDRRISMMSRHLMTMVEQILYIANKKQSKSGPLSMAGHYCTGTKSSRIIILLVPLRDEI